MSGARSPSRLGFIVERELSKPSMPLLSALVGVLLTLPALWTGRAADDWFHCAILRGAGPFARSSRPLGELFTFVGDNVPHASAWKEYGLGAWWMDSSARISLMRPLAALTHVLDERLWPDNLPLYHAQSLVWYGLAVLVAAAWLSRLLGANAAAGVAALLFAVEDAHGMPATWIANRNALVAFVASVVALLLHNRWQKRHRMLDLSGGLVALSAALLASEAALGAIAYLVAWHVTMDQRKLGSRVLALLPWGVPLALWAALYHLLGHGVQGSGVYLDPVQHPLLFLAALPERTPVLLLSLWSKVPIDIWAFLPRTVQLLMTLAGVLTTLGVVAVMLPVLKARPEARLFALGSLLSMVPLCGAFPMTRLLLFPSLGAAGLLAVAAQQLTDLLGANQPPGCRWRRYAIIAALVAHGPVSALLLPIQCWGVPRFSGVFEKLEPQLPTDSDVPKQALLVVQAPDLVLAQLIIIRACRGGVLPQKAAVLASVMSKGTAFRSGPKELVIRVVGGWLREPFDRMFRSPQRPFRRGEILQNGSFTAEVRELTPEGMPLEVVFRFQNALEDPGFRWVTMLGGKVIDWVPPRVGESKALEADVVDLLNYL